MLIRQSAPVSGVERRETFRREETMKAGLGMIKLLPGGTVIDRLPQMDGQAQCRWHGNVSGVSLLIGSGEGKVVMLAQLVPTPASFHF